MDTANVIHELRTKNGLSQDELAGKVFVTRQAVSRWENGETVPNTETLKLLSKLFKVSINTLLGSPQTLYCQCCGMPLSDDSMISKEKDGTFNEDYCKWCYADGQFTYKSKETLLDFLVAHMPNPENQPESERRALYDSHLSQLKHWR
jgi:transcriptional regulator with XRE-family HTH domain